MKYETLKPYIEKKLISEQVHPEDPNVRIFNYTQHCQFSSAWDEVTRQCRGLIMNIETGEILARPFPKFFNYQEHIAKGWPIPDELPVISEKMDGSLGILYKLNGVPWIATRGSFMSDQAIWATKWWRDNLAMLPEDGETHLFEIIYPANRIVVSYDYSGLVHLATLNTESGADIPRHWGEPVRSAKRYDLKKNFEELAAMGAPNSEGFVVNFPIARVRMKIKHAEYVRLHRIVTGVNEIAIWEMLRDGKGLSELITNVPDEFFVWVKGVSERLLDSYDEIADEVEKIFERVKDLPTRKDQAFAVNQMTDNHAGIVFALLDGKGKAASLAIWRKLRPHGQSVFKTDIDL